MFDRKKYKDFAKIQLKNRWTVPVLMTLVSGIILCFFQLPSVITEVNSILNSSVIYDPSTSFSDNYYALVQAIAEAESPLEDLLSFLQLAVTSIFAYAVLTVYIKMSRSPEKVQFKSFIEGLSSALRAIGLAFWQYLWVFLWTLLFIIPGIVKSYAYSQMFYIAAEYPEVSITQSMEISKIITKGHKWDLFVLDLSFIGWSILAIFTAGIGYLWLMPYMRMTKTNAYHALLKEAVEKGLIRAEDLQ